MKKFEKIAELCQVLTVGTIELLRCFMVMLCYHATPYRPDCRYSMPYAIACRTLSSVHVEIHAVALACSVAEAHAA
eukprot:10321064-Alexandrium_andersonii.AAC.1